MTIPPAIRICVISIQSKRRAALRARIESKEIHVAGECAGADAIAAVAQVPDIVVIEVDSRVPISAQSIRQLKAHWPQTKVLVLVSQLIDSHIIGAIESGADGYLVSTEPTSVLLKAILGLARGHAAMSPAVLDRIVAYLRSHGERIGQVAKLSPRERQILLGLVDGLSYKQIACCFELSAETINWHIKRIYHKLNVHSRGEATTMFTTSNLPFQRGSGNRLKAD